jgi:MYXO-CTERM domain-containing protein
LPLLEIFLLAIASMLWPLLLVVVVIALSTTQPARILGWFWAGGMLTTVAVGSVLVFVLQDSPLMHAHNKLPSAPEISIVVGALALLAAVALTRVRRRRGPRTQPSESSRWERWVEGLVANGGPLAFAGGILGSIFPSPLVIVGMASIAQLDTSAGATFAVIVAFYLVMFTLIEVPLAGFIVAPDWTRRRVVPVNNWLRSNLLTLAIWALAIAGVAELVRGIVNLLR